MRCDNCGAGIGIDTVFCPRCGKKFGDFVARRLVRVRVLGAESRFKVKVFVEDGEIKKGDVLYSDTCLELKIVGIKPSFILGAGQTGFLNLVHARPRFFGTYYSQVTRAEALAVKYLYDEKTVRMLSGQKGEEGAGIEKF